MNRSIGSISVIPLSVLTLALLGCASSMNQVQPGLVIMDRSGINYPGDSQDCRRIAESYDYTETATNQAVQDGVTAGVIGGIAGAAIGSFSGHAGSGAGIGAIVGVGTRPSTRRLTSTKTLPVCGRTACRAEGMPFIPSDSLARLREQSQPPQGNPHAYRRPSRPPVANFPSRAIAPGRSGRIRGGDV